AETCSACSVICPFGATRPAVISQVPRTSHRARHTGGCPPSTRVVEPLQLPRDRCPSELPLAERPATVSHRFPSNKWLTGNVGHPCEEAVHVGRGNDTRTRRAHQRPYVDLVGDHYR